MADAFIEKKINTGYDQNGFLDDFIYARKPDAEATEDEISLNGYTFELDRSVPELGEYIGESGNLPARIRKINITNITETEISIEVITARAEGATFKYYLDDEGEPRETTSTNTYTYLDLKPLTEYTVKVVLVDKNGNEIEKSIVVETNPVTIESVLREGDYVNYVDGTGETRKCVVLYGPENANYSSYGIQIITMENVEEVTLGRDDPTVTESDNLTRAMNSYNNAINTLNNATSKYLNTIYASSARCVGSLPDNPNYDTSDMFIKNNTWFSVYNGKLKNTDNNYLIDENQIKKLDIDNTRILYFYASRIAMDRGSDVLFGIRIVRSDGQSVFGVFSNSQASSNVEQSGLRPVFTLKSEIKVTGGNGTEESPYTLGV